MREKYTNLLTRGGCAEGRDTQREKERQRLDDETFTKVVTLGTIR